MLDYDESLKMHFQVVRFVLLVNHSIPIKLSKEIYRLMLVLWIYLHNLQGFMHVQTQT